MEQEPPRLNAVDLGLREFARGQRRDMTTAEAVLWQQVRARRFRGLKFKRQVPVVPYVADFLCASARLVVELDGPVHDDETRRRKDAARDAWLGGQGFTVLRFPTDLVLSKVGAVLNAIGAALDAHLPPPFAGEGGPRRGSGEGSTALSGQVFAGSHILPASRSPLPPAPQAPSPAEGGGE